METMLNALQKVLGKLLVRVVGEVPFPSFCPERGYDVLKLRRNVWILLPWLLFQGFEVLCIPVPSLLQVAERLTCCMESNCESAFVSPRHWLDPIDPQLPAYLLRQDLPLGFHLHRKEL